MANLGKAKRKPLPDVVSEVPHTGIDEVVRLAKLSGQLKTQASAANNKWKWKQYYENEALLKKEIEKWKTPQITQKP